MAGGNNQNPGLVNADSALQLAYQTGMLSRMFEEGLDSEAAYAHDAVVEIVPAGIGQTITKTRISRLLPQVTPLNPMNIGGLDNGLSPITPTAEQYTYAIQQYGAVQYLDLVQEQAGIANQLKQFARNNGVNAAQTVERLMKQNWFANYNTGATWIRSDLGSVTSTTFYVDDIRGFQFNYVNGKPEAVSVSNPLPCVEVAFDGGTSQSFSVTAAVSDSVTRSVYPSSVVGGSSDGVSGQLTITGATVGSPVAGDAVISSLASPVFRPNNKQATNQLNSNDLITVALLQTAQASLSQNAVPRHKDGTYHCYMDYQSMTELLVDPQFQVMYASRGNNEIYQNNQVFTFLGMTIIPTTEAYLQAIVPSAGMQSGQAPSTVIHRVLITGAEGINIGHFVGIKSYADREAVGSVSNIYLVDNIAHIIRSPIDNMGRNVSLAWLGIFAIVCPTDLTATPSIIPTASNSAFKRAVTLEHC